MKLFMYHDTCTSVGYINTPIHPCIYPAIPKHPVKSIQAWWYITYLCIAWIYIHAPIRCLHPWDPPIHNYPVYERCAIVIQWKMLLHCILLWTKEHLLDRYKYMTGARIALYNAMWKNSLASWLTLQVMVWCPPPPIQSSKITHWSIHMVYPQSYRPRL